MRRQAAALLALALAAAASSSCTAPPSAKGANVLLVVVDTLRADHLGCYGYAKPTSPNLDALASRGTRFSSARAASSWTLPSVASLLTGLYPAVHGAERADASLSEDLDTVADDFAAAGYATAAFSANPAFVTPKQGLARGFEHFDVLHGPAAEPRSVGAVPATASLQHWVKEASGSDVTEAARSWLARRDAARPFFLYVHYFDPHAAYTPPAEYAARFGVSPTAALAGDAQWDYLLAPTAPLPGILSTMVKLYDAEIAVTDAAIGRLLESIPADVLANTLVVVTADHGEEFGEHGGVQHGRTLFEELVHVPLVVAGPAVAAGRVVETPVSLVSLRATLTRLTAVAPEGPAGAEPAIDALVGSASTSPAAVFADLDERFPGDAQRHRRAVVDGSWKLLLAPSGEASLFDVAKDPAERTDDAAGQAGTVDALRKQVEERDSAAVAKRAAAPPKRSVLDGATREKLKALGYLQ